LGETRKYVDLTTGKTKKVKMVSTVLSTSRHLSEPSVYFAGFIGTHQLTSK